MDYYSWQKAGTPVAPYTKTSPNISEWLKYMLLTFGGVNLGTYVYRLVRDGFVWSSHAWGAAWDWGYTLASGVVDRALALRGIEFLIAHHEVLGVQMIVDEAYNRTWKCWRDELGGPGWKAGLITTGGNWLHVETTKDAWPLSTSVASRLAPIPAPIPPVTPPTTEEDTMRLIQPFNDIAVLIEDGLECTWAQDGNVVAALIKAGIVQPEVTVVDRIGLKGLVLVGPAPTDAAYAGAPPDRPGRTKATDFAGHRPNG